MLLNNISRCGIAPRGEVNMNKMICGILGLTMITAGIYPVGVTVEAAVKVNVEVNLGPPVIMVDEPPEIVFVPGLGIYFVPNLEMEIFFYRGFWWSRRGNYWYSSRYYRSGWKIASDREVPGPVFRVPRDYRERFGRERHIRYQDWKKQRNQPKNEGKGGRKNKSSR